MAQRRNPLSYLGWLGLVGFVGVWAYTPMLIVFFLFFFFFAYGRMTPDELFWENVRRAVLRALTVNLVLSGASAVGLFLRALYRWPAAAVQVEGGVVSMPESLYLQHMLIAGGSVLIFICTLCTFLFTLMYFNHREKRYTEDPSC